MPALTRTTSQEAIQIYKTRVLHVIYLQLLPPEGDDIRWVTRLTRPAINRFSGSRAWFARLF